MSFLGLATLIYFKNDINSRKFKKKIFVCLCHLKVSKVFARAYDTSKLTIIESLDRLKSVLGEG